LDFVERLYFTLFDGDAAILPVVALALRGQDTGE